MSIPAKFGKLTGIAEIVSMNSKLRNTFLPAKGELSMITKELIARINVLAQKQKQTGLSDAEKQEQAALRRQYLDGIKAQVRSQIDAAVAPSKHGGHCSCGCHGEHRH